MDRCAAPGCSSELKNGVDGLGFFPFPTDPKLKNSWETNLRISDLPQSSVICDKHFSLQDVICGDDGAKSLKPGSVPSIFPSETINEEHSSVRRSNRKRMPNNRGISKGDENEVTKKKSRAGRPLFKTVSKPTEKNKRPRASNDEDENSDPNQDLVVKRSPGRPRKNKESCGTPRKSPKKVKLIGDDERGHAIAEWYLIDVFEATRVITSVLPKGTLVTDNLVANMEETIIDIVSKLLQRLSSVLITSLEEELGVTCNIMAVLKNVHQNIKENVKNLAMEENKNSTSPLELEEDNYEEALRKLDFTDPVFVTEEVISPAFDEDSILYEHSYSRPSEQEAESGLKNTKETRTKLQCGFCAFKTYWKSKLRRHINHHLQGKRFDCSLCDYSASSNEAFTKHFRTHTGEKPFSCNVCDFRTANKSNLHRHSFIHTELKPFSCPHCDYATRQKGTLEQHIVTHTKTLKERGKGKKCVYVCGTCDFLTLSRPEFNSHVRIHKEYNCGHCDFVTKDYHELRAHQGVHNGEAHACQHCSRKCKSADELRLHLETHDATGEELVCDMCHYRTFKPTYFKRHIAVHSGERPFKCDTCLSTFRLQSHLTMHIRKHEIGPYCKRSSM